MIKNIWNSVRIVCADHTDTPEMEISPKQKYIQYVCPKCNNHISADDFEKVIQFLMKKMEEAEFNDELVDLTNVKWTARKTEYKVLCFKNDKIVVSADNRKITHKGGINSEK